MEKETKDNRYAFEWFMREEDKRYWEKTEKLVKKEKKKIATLILINAAISVMVFISSIVRLCTCQKR